MAYEDLCLYCFENMAGKTVCPHCGMDSRKAVPQIQMLPGSRVYHDRFLIGRALGQDAQGVVYAAFDTKKENRLRIREYLPRDCAERLNDGAIVPMAGQEDRFEAGLKKLRASVESVEDPRKRHFFFEENGTAYIVQRKSAAAGVEKAYREEEEEEETGSSRRVLLFAGIAVAVLLVAAILLITLFNGAFTTGRDVAQSPTLDPDQVWIPLSTPTPTPYVAPTFAALVDPELSWMDYTYEGDVEAEYQQAQRSSATATPVPTAPRTTAAQGERIYSMIDVGSSRAAIQGLQQKLSDEGWLDEADISGRYDSATRQAVRDLQTYVNERYNPRQKLTVDGIAGPKTQQWLYEADIRKPTPTPRAKVTPKPDAGTVDRDSSQARVRAMQQKLVELGLLPASAADGRYGATTAAAVRRFQTRVNQLAGYEVLEVSGVMDAQSLAFLDYYVEQWQALLKATAKPTATPRATRRPTPTPTTRPVEVLDGVIDGKANREDILKVQQLLVDIGMLPRKGADGVYGSATISAVADFQQWVNTQRREKTLEVNGQVDQLTLLYLQYCKDHGMMPYATAEPTATAKPTVRPTAEPLTLVEDDEPEDPGEGSQEISIDERSQTESIRYVQEMLSAVGAMEESGIDGVYGKSTVSAVRWFQRWVNSIQGEGTLPEDGKVDNRTRLALEYAYDHELKVEEVEETPTPAPEETPGPTPSPQPLLPEEEEPDEGGEISVGEDSDEESIRFVQEMLNAAGLLEAEGVNGVYDGATKAAVRRFQTWVNSVRGEGTLPVTGQLDDLTRQALEYAYDHEMRIEERTPEEVPTEAPTEAPAASKVSDVQIAFDGVRAGRDVLSISEGEVEVRWSAEGEVDSYAVRVEDENGKTIVNREGIQDTGFTIDTERMAHGTVYTLYLGVLPQGGTREDVVWQTVYFTLPEQHIFGVDPEEEETDLTEEPVEEPLEEIPEEEPEPEAEPIVGEVTAPQITVAGVSAGSSAVIVEEDFSINWAAEGDLETYYVRVTDSDGGDMMEPRYTTQTGANLRAANLEEGEVYTLLVGAVPVGGSQEDMVVSQAKFMRPVRETPEPTATPEPEPEVARIGRPVINVGGSAYQEGGISYMTGSSIIVNWTAEGDVESYEVYVENASGERQELGVTTDTSRTVSTRSLPAGVYTIYVGALPRGGGEEDVQWASTRFGIPEPMEAPQAQTEPEGDAEDPDDDESLVEEPEEAEAPGDEVTGEEASEAAAVSGVIDGTDPQTVQQLQLKLYSMGYLSADAEEGVLDAYTLRAVAEYQTQKNEQEDAGLDVVDPGDLSSVVDKETVSALFSE